MKKPLQTLLILTTALLTGCATFTTSEPVAVRIETSLPTAQTNLVTLAVDGKMDTFFKSRRRPDDKDVFTLYFSRGLNLKEVDVQTGTEEGTGKLLDGVVEVSTDGKSFKEAGKFESGVAKAMPGMGGITAVRIRPTARGESQLVIREITLSPAPKIESVKQEMCVTVDTSEAPELDAWGLHAKELCDEWYPKILALLPSEGFNPPMSARLLFSKSMRGVAATGGTDIRISVNYVLGHTNDFGMVIHELTHVAQAYGYQQESDGYSRPGWLVEGIADDIRLFHFEPDMPRPRINPDRASYKDAYKTTAGFLDWVERTYDKELVKKLNAALRQGVYQDGLWQKYTGKSVDDLWKEFTDTLRKKS